MKKHIKKYINGRILSVFLALALVITALPYIPASVVYAAQSSDNPIENGSFENGLENWETYFNDQYSGTIEIKDYKAAINFSFFNNWWDWDAENNVAVDKGPVDWSTQLSQKNIHVNQGEEYKLKFTASSTVKRPIAVSMYTQAGTRENSKKELIIIEKDKEQTYEIDYTPISASLDLTFYMGQFTEEQSPELPYTTKEFEKHTIYISDIKLVDSNNADNEEAPKPRIIGVKDGVEYTAPVSVKVNYKKPYILEIKKDGKVINYNEGDQIISNGEYSITVTDKEDTSISEIIDFTINFQPDYSKEWLVIYNKSTGMVMQTGGSSGNKVMQGTYTGKAAQFFCKEDAGSGYIRLRSMTSGDVLTATVNDNKLETAKEDGSDWQLWKIDNTVPQGYVKFINKHNELVIGVTGATKIDGQSLSLEEKSSNEDEEQQNNDAQRWDIISTVDVKEAIEGKTVDVSTDKKWALNSIVTPVVNGLNPAGQITVEFYPLERAKSYSIYFDGEKKTEVTKAQLDSATIKDNYMTTKDGTIKIFNAAYSTKVSKHTLYIQTDTGVKTDTIDFYISKKGSCWSTLHRTEDMDIGWYYNWSTNESVGTDKYLEFVPMLWGNYGDEWLKDSSNKRYGKVLSFNEPDWSDQSNVPVTIKSATEWAKRKSEANDGEPVNRPSTIEEVWQSFMDSGLRIGSPATAIAPPYCDGRITMNNIDGPDTWWFDFMDLMKENSSKGWDYDFVAVHSYDAGCDAKGFLKMVDETHELTGKPIWITEFGVAEWNENKQWKGGNAETTKKVLDFMKEVIEGLEERDFVERYAWFPFNPQDEYGGASGIFDYRTGELTELGKLYKSLGVPEGYDPDKKGQGNNKNPDDNINNDKPDNDNSNNDNNNNGNNNNSNSNNNNNNNSNNSSNNNNNSSNNSGNSNNSSSNSNNNSNNLYYDQYYMNILPYLINNNDNNNSDKQKQEKELKEEIKKYLEDAKIQMNGEKDQLDVILEKLQKALLKIIKVKK